MLCSIDDYQLTDGTLPGGVALSQTRINVTRVFDVIISLGQLNPILLDRTTRQTSVDFQITRIHSSVAAAEIFIADHDAAIPSSGTVQFTTTHGAIYFLFSAALITHQLLTEIGAMTTHAYHIEGGHVHVAVNYILTETGFHILMETSGKIQMEF